MAFAARAAKPKAIKRPLTDRQREILSTDRAHKRMLARQEQSAIRVRAIQSQVRVAEDQEIARNRQSAITRGYITRHTAGTVAGAVKRGTAPVVNPVFLVLGFMFGLIIFYNLVTHPGPTTGFANSLASGIHKLSATTPLFTKVTTSS